MKSKRIPNREEQHIIDNLKFQEYICIEFEPDGNNPPDILLDKSIAIEVRRLNQNIKVANGFEGLEQDDRKVYRLIEKAIIRVADLHFTKSAFIHYQFKRPLPLKHYLKIELARIIESHKACIEEEKWYSLGPHFKVLIFPSEERLQRQFEVGGSIDENSGGMVVAEIYKNLKLINEEKEKKVKKFIGNYPKWWLALVDTIGLGTSDYNFHQFCSVPKLEYNFDRILLVDMFNPKLFRFLYE